MTAVGEKYPCMLKDELCGKKECRYWIMWLETGNCAGRADREHTLEEVGSALGITRERVRQVEQIAMKKIKEMTGGRRPGGRFGYARETNLQH